jgi:hypothetical protein
MNVKALMTAAAEAMLRGDADAVEKANVALAELRSGQVDHVRRLPILGAPVPVRHVATEE